MKNSLTCSVIVLSYNTYLITDECLKKLKQSVQYAKHKGYDTEVIVIDNASSDGSVEMIKKQHSWVKLIASKENTGFSKGNNIGMQESVGQYILLLNSDAFVEENTLFEAINFFERNEKCDVMGCQLQFLDGKLQHSAGYLPEPINTSLWITGLSNLPLLGEFRPIHPKYKSFFATIHNVGWVMGAFFMLRRSVYQQTKGFDEKLFMYGEEVEWCKRIKNQGFNIWYFPNIKIKHIHKASSKNSESTPFISEVKSFVYFLKKYHTSFYPIIKVIMVFGLVFRAVVFAFLMKPSRSSAYIKSLLLV